LVDGTDYRYWKQMLIDIDDESLLRGFRGTEDFNGYLTWSEFKRLCQKPDKPLSHEYYLPPPKKSVLSPEERKSRMQQLRKELGV